MALFELLHLLAALLGIGAIGALIGPWRDHTERAVMGLWLGVAVVAGTGIILSLSAMGRGAPVAADLLFGKVALTAAVLIVVYVDLAGRESETAPPPRPYLLAIAGLWIVAFALGVMLVH